MQVTSRVNRREGARRYVTPTMKGSIGHTRVKTAESPTILHTSPPPPKKPVDATGEKSNEPPTLKKLIDRFRYDEPQARPDRDSVTSEFWWLHDELKNNSRLESDGEEDERKSNVPEFIEIFPSTDIDQDLNKRASLLLNQTFSAHSSDTGHISSAGVGSMMATTNTANTFRSSSAMTMTYEQPARPIFTRIADPKIDYRIESSDDDILYQWRLRRRLEQAQKGEPITFSSKVSHRSAMSPAGSPYPPMIPVGVIQVTSPSPLPPTSPPVVSQSSPKRERQASSATNTESLVAPTSARHFSEASTQTLQDACSQTSLVLSTTVSTTPQGLDLQPTRDNDQHSPIWHRPPARSKCESTQISSTSSPVKRAAHHTFRPVVVAEHPSIAHHRSHRSSAMPVQSSQESTLTHVTSIVVHDRPHPTLGNSSIAVIDEFQEHSQDETLEDWHDDILDILQRKRDELLTQFQAIEHSLAKLTS